MDVLCLGIMACDILTKLDTEGVFKRDTTITQSVSTKAGGDALNVAINLSKMGVSSGICGKIGNDSYGRFLEETVKEEGVETRYIVKDDDETTSVSIVLISNEGQRNFLYYPGTTAAFTLEDICPDMLDGIKCLIIGSYFGLQSFADEKMKTLLEQAKKRGIMTVLDVTNNPVPENLPSLEMILPYVDYFIPSIDEAASVSGLDEPEQMLTFFKDRGAKTVIIKMGDKGAIGLADNEIVYVPSMPDTPVDTTGAGDCFVAGMIASVLKGLSLDKSMLFACKAAGLSITKIGATTATVRYEEIEKRYPDYEKKIIRKKGKKGEGKLWH